MGYNELVRIDDELSNKPNPIKSAKDREPFIQQLVDDFVGFYQNKSGFPIQAIDDIAAKLSLAYFTMCYTDVKPVIQDKTNRFKMASIMELIINKEQVLIHPGSEEDNRELNAQFGMTAALSLISCMICDATKDFHFITVNTEIDNKVQGILEDHRVWLKTKPLNSLPIFINAQFYELIEIMYYAPYQVHGE